MNDRQRVRFLHGPYWPPAMKRGDRAFCLLRDCDVVITGWSDGRIRWPRCRALDSRGGSGLLVDETLAWVIRHESAASIRYWLGVGVKAVWAWRRALAVTRTNNEGTRRLMLAASRHGARVLKLNGLSDAVCDRMSERSKRLNLIRFAHRGCRGRWTKKELRLLGSMPDEELATRIGRSKTAVRVMRNKRRIPGACDRRRRSAPPDRRPEIERLAADLWPATASFRRPGPSPS